MAFETSSSVRSQDDGFFFRFPDGTLQIGIRKNDVLPGSAETVECVTYLLALNSDLVRYIVETETGGHIIETADDGSHQVLGSLLAEDLPVEGYGIAFNGNPVAYDETTGRSYFSGYGSNPDRFGDGYAACAVIDSEYRMAVDAHPLPGLGGMVTSLSGAHGGKIYGVATDPAGGIHLVEATPTFAIPQLATTEVTVDSDPTLRFTADNLTLGRTYAVERLAPGGSSWETLREFLPGARTALILGSHEARPGEFFRLRVASP